MILHWPQITLILLSAIGIGMVMKQHGQITAPSKVLLVITVMCLLAWVQYKGGFFDSTGLPQLIMICYFGFVVGDSIANTDQYRYNMYKSFAYTVVYQGVLIAGGFYGVL